MAYSQSPERFAERAFAKSSYKMLLHYMEEGKTLCYQIKIGCCSRSIREYFFHLLYHVLNPKRQ